MKPTEQEDSCQGIVEAMNKRWVQIMTSLGSVSAITIIVPPRLIDGR
jgi:hypothetical protein